MAERTDLLADELEAAPGAGERIVEADGHRLLEVFAPRRPLGGAGAVVEDAREDLVEADPLTLERARHPLLARHLAHDGPSPPPRRRQPERGRHGGPPDAALARHEHEPLVE